MKSQRLPRSLLIVMPRVEQLPRQRRPAQQKEEDRICKEFRLEQRCRHLSRLDNKLFRTCRLLKPPNGFILGDSVNGSACGPPPWLYHDMTILIRPTPY